MNSLRRHTLTALGVFGCASLLALAPGSTPAHAASASAKTASFDGVWGHFPPVVTSPPGMQLGGAFCDAARNRVLFFGGRNAAGAMNDVWTSPLTGVPAWSRLAVSGTPPPPRYALSMVYDPVRDRLLVFGGTVDGRSSFGDLWQLTLSGTPTWTQLAVGGAPPSRFGHVAVYDPVGDRMILFGGSADAVTFYGDTWQLSLAGTPAWTQLSFSGSTPQRRYYSTAAYDPNGQRMLLVSGSVLISPPFPTLQGDLWALKLAGTPAWTKLTPLSGFTPAEAQAASFYDPVRNRLLVMGGDSNLSVPTNLYALSLDGSLTWTHLSPSSGAPGRQGACFVYDPTSDRGIAYGGLQSAGVFGDEWALSLGSTPSWSLLEAGPEPLARLIHRAEYDPGRNRLVEFGGATYVGPVALNLNDTWALDLMGAHQWTRLGQASPTLPLPRSSYAMGRDPVGDRLILFGGNDNNTFFNDVWSFNLASETWTQLSPTGPPPAPVEAMASVFDAARSRLIYFGGWDRSIALNALVELDLLPVPTWRGIDAVGARPTPRFGSSLVYDSLRDRLVMFGGYDQNSDVLFGDTWSINLTGTPVWTQLTTAGTAPTPRDAHCAMYDPVRDRMVVFGGWTHAMQNGVYALDFSGATPTWSQLSPTGTPPSPRDLAASVYDVARDRFVITGGNLGSGVLPIGDTWTLTFSEQATPTLLTFADEQTGAGTVRLTWYTPDGAGQQAVAQRSPDGAAWETIAALTSDASGEFVLVDAVPAGGRFEYRIGVGAPGAEQFADGHWVTIPAGVAFGITGTGANPSRGALAVAFALPQAGPASLDLYDIAGRRLVHRDVGSLGAGPHTLDLAGERALGSGVYWVRLAQGARVAQRKVAVVR